MYRVWLDCLVGVSTRTSPATALSIELDPMARDFWMPGAAAAGLRGAPPPGREVISHPDPSALRRAWGESSAAQNEALRLQAHSLFASATRQRNQRHVLLQLHEKVGNFQMAAAAILLLTLAPSTISTSGHSLNDPMREDKSPCNMQFG